MEFFNTVQLNGFPLWVVLLICCGVFLAAFMDSIAGGGGIISVPTYLLAFHGLPTYYALGTNKLSSFIGLTVSSGRFIKNGYVKFSRKHKTLLKQMTEYPMGKNDDGPDGLQMAVKLALDVKVGRKVEYKSVIARALDFKRGAY